jgi:hypothetical protein
MFLSATKMVGAVVVSVGLAVGVSACGSVDGLTGGPPPAGRDTYIVTDDSGSTAPQRGVGGLYEQAVIQAVVGTAREGDGRVYAAPIDGDSIADTTWIIDGQRFTSPISGNQQISAAVRVHQAEQVRPLVRRLLHTTPRAGSDILGALQRVALSAHATGWRHTRLVLVTDGGLNVGGYDIYRAPPQTAAQCEQIIGRLRRAGELADLHGFDVYLVGVGLGYHSRGVARAAIALWHDLILAMGGRLVSNDIALRFP